MKKLADVLTREKWVKGASGDGHYTMCLGTAITVAAGLKVVVNHPVKLFVRHDESAQELHIWADERMRALLIRRRGDPGVVAFNDHPRTTWDDVRAVIAEFDELIAQEIRETTPCEDPDVGQEVPRQPEPEPEPERRPRRKEPEPVPA
jgi:hypothetical protein